MFCAEIYAGSMAWPACNGIHGNCRVVTILREVTYMKTFIRHIGVYVENSASDRNKCFTGLHVDI